MNRQRSMGAALVAVFGVWAGIVFIPLECGAAQSGPLVSIASDEAPGLGALHGLKKLGEALRASGAEVQRVDSLGEARGEIVIAAGLATGAGPAAALLGESRAPTPQGPESLAIRHARWEGKPALLVCGSDDRGVMYALLDVADRIGWTSGSSGSSGSSDSSNPLSEVRDTSEKPYTPERALSVYTMHRELDESYLHDPEYWARFLDTLAENRFNSFVYILGYSPATYLAPAYPNYFDVEGYPDVRFEGLSGREQARNLAALNRIVDMTHERGMNFTLGIWDHIPRGGTSADYPLPVGVDSDNVIPYTKAALEKLLRVVPDLDAIQFRMHWESGLPRDEQQLIDFWGSVFQIVKDSGRDIRVDARAKGLPDSVIERGLASGVRFRLTTKYWAEELGLPFHPTHINRKNQHDRRHGYADLLVYPPTYKMHWKLWNAGTSKFLLWGDPDYARRFAKSTLLYDGDGFEVNAPLATKMARHPGEKPFDLLNEPYQYYDYEFERYWHFFQVFGRLGYNPETPPEVWSREFERRFGPEAGPLIERALHRASQVLPRITAYGMTQFPTLSGFTEKASGGDLASFAKTLPSDIQIFLSMEEAAQLRIQGKDSPKVWPRQTSAWFEAAAQAILRDVAEAGYRIGDAGGKEFESTVVDLKILAHLARYHARRIPAGVHWAIFERTQDSSALDEAIRHEKRAIAAYGKIVQAAGDFYAEDLMFGRSEPPHWRDELALLEADFDKLLASRTSASPLDIERAVAIEDSGAGDHEAPTVEHRAIERAPAARPLTVSARVADPSGIRWVRLRYRPVTQFEDYQTLEMKRVGQTDEYRAVVPADRIKPRWDFMYLIEAMDSQGNGRIYPDFEIEAPYIVVRLDRRAFDGE